jgi:hypothetical protein
MKKTYTRSPFTSIITHSDIKPYKLTIRDIPTEKNLVKNFLEKGLEFYQ